ncbi:annexin A7-like [Eurosta solidaginis]|uniref:annexin A7-like n=1 Tax=Eurosta solidaginis TaxID=178769 RepID=UPI0035311CDE
MPPQLGPMPRQSGLMQSQSDIMPPQHRMHQQFGGHEQHGPPGMPPASTGPGGAMTPHPVIPRYIPQQQPGYAMPLQQQQQPPQPGYLPMPQQPGYPPQPGYPQQRLSSTTTRCTRWLHGSNDATNTIWTGAND